MRRVVGLTLSLLFCVAGGCQRRAAAPPAADDSPQRSAMRSPTDSASKEPRDRHSSTKKADPKSARVDVEPKPLVRCFPGDASGAPQRPLEALLDRAADLYDRGDFLGSLACAEEAARVEPRSVEAHHDRAAALEELKRLDEAAVAFQRALALDPDDPETLAGAADLYINRLPPSNDHTEIGLEYARRGSDRLRRPRLQIFGKAKKQARDAHVSRALVARLALLEGQALNDLGRSREALARLDAAIAAAPDDIGARYERAVALFDLCRFADAKRGFLDVLERSPNDAWAHHHLGLALEQLGDHAGAERELAAARTLAPDDFRPPIELPPAEFRALVDAEVKKLPPPLRADLAKVKLETADLPDLKDLTAEEPPLAPTILGLFRGAPLDEALTQPDEPRTIVIYRKNLARAVTTREELAAQVRTTLLHELGHLRGEDDDALRARGLE
jgi:tetratricopeptide (TPR) repeat protein